MSNSKSDKDMLVCAHFLRTISREHVPR